MRCFRHISIMKSQWRVDPDHWLSGAARYPSDNSDARTDPNDISLVVIHGISLPPGSFGGDQVKQFFTNCLDCSAHPSLADLVGVRVSSHLFIERTGRTLQFVPFDRRAWHAGVSNHRGRIGCNDFSIGIEMEGTDEVAYDDRQYDSLADAIVALLHRYRSISLDGIVGHSDIAPGRKTDPGAAFDWPRLYASCLTRLGVSRAAHRS